MGWEGEWRDCRAVEGKERRRGNAVGEREREESKRSEKILVFIIWSSYIGSLLLASYCSKV